MKKCYDITPYVSYTGYCSSCEPKRVSVSKSHSPNAARLSSALSLLPIKSGEHGSSRNFYLLAGLKYLPYCLQNLLWFAPVHTRAYLPLGETQGFPGQALVQRCRRAAPLLLPSSVSRSQADLRSWKLCTSSEAAFVQLLLLPLVSRGQSLSLPPSGGRGSGSSCFLALLGAVVCSVLPAETLYLFLQEVTSLKIRCWIGSRNMLDPTCFFTLPTWLTQNPRHKYCMPSTQGLRNRKTKGVPAAVYPQLTRVHLTEKTLLLLLSGFKGAWLWLLTRYKGRPWSNCIAKEIERETIKPLVVFTT